MGSGKWERKDRLSEAGFVREERVHLIFAFPHRDSGEMNTCAVVVVLLPNSEKDKYANLIFKDLSVNLSQVERLLWEVSIFYSAGGNREWRAGRWALGLGEKPKESPEARPPPPPPPPPLSLSLIAAGAYDCDPGINGYALEHQRLQLLLSPLR